MKRALLVIACALLLLAAGRRHFFHVPNDQVTINRLAWNELAEEEREALRANLRRVRALSGVEQDRVLRRMETLSRLLVKDRRSSDRHMPDRDLRAELAGLEQRVSNWLPDLSGSGQPASDRVSRRTGRLLNQFIEQLTFAGRLDPAERDRLLATPYPQRVIEGLELQKHEEIFFLSETAGARDADELEQLEPLAVVFDAWDQRRRRGFLGRAGRTLGLTPDDLQRLAEVPDEELVGLLRELMVPKVRAQLEQRGLAPQRIEAILAKPYRELERALDELERAGR